MNAFEAQKQVENGFVQLTKPRGNTFRFIIFNGEVQALTANDLPLEEGDERWPSQEDLSNNCWEIFYACKLNGNRNLPIWFTGFRNDLPFADGRSEPNCKESAR